MIPLQTNAGHPVTHIVFSPDGGTVAVAQPHYGVTLLERTTGRALGVCALPRRDVLTGLTFCGEGRYLAAASAKGVEVFDATTGAALAHSFRPMVKSLLLADDGTATVGAGAKGVRVEWRPDPVRDPNYGYREFRRNTARTVDALSPDGRFAVLGGRQAGAANVLFDLDAGRFVASLKPVGADACTLKPGAAKFCPHGRRFAINDGHTLDVYDTSGSGDDAEEQYAGTPLVQRANGINPNAATTIAVAPMPHVALDPVFTLKPEKPSGEPWHPPFALLPDGRGLLVKRPRNRVQLWDAPTGSLVNEWSWRFEWVTCVAVSNDGLTAVAGGRFGRVLLWDLD